MALAKRNEGANVNSDINVTPMVDVMLVLLVIFMVITPMLQKGISVVTGKVKDRLINKQSKMVYVKADARAHFGNVVQVVDAVRAAGVDDLGLLTEQRKSTPNAPPAAPAGGQ